jgi:hypothetical protein
VANFRAYVGNWGDHLDLVRGFFGSSVHRRLLLSSTTILGLASAARQRETAKGDYMGLLLIFLFILDVIGD